MSSGVFIEWPFHTKATRKGQSKGRLRVLCIVVLGEVQVRRVYPDIFDACSATYGPPMGKI